MIVEYFAKKSDKEYNKTNTEEIKERGKKYHDSHIEEIKENTKQEYRDIGSLPTPCECGSVVTRNFERHLKSNKPFL